MSFFDDLNQESENQRITIFFVNHKRIVELFATNVNS